MALRNSTIPLYQKLIIESHSYCNRSCWFCPRVYDRSGVYLDKSGKPIHKRMATTKILELLDQAKDMGFQGYVSFFFYSEPLADDRNIELANAARELGMKPYMHTNGDLLRENDDLSRKIQEVYKYIVIGIYDYETNEELELEKSYWQKKLPNTTLKFSTIGRENAKTAKSMGIPRALVPSDSRFTIPDFSFKNAPCHQPLLRMIIRYDGKMANCCEDIQGDFELGDVYENTLEELWYSEEHQHTIHLLLQGDRDNHELCQQCPLIPAGPSINGQKILFIPRKNRPVG